MYEKETGLVVIDISGWDNSRWIYCFYQFLHMHRSIKKQGEQRKLLDQGGVLNIVCDLACLRVQYVSLAPRVVDAHVET